MRRRSLGLHWLAEQAPPVGAAHARRTARCRPKAKQEVAILLLPMHSVGENALMVNALPARLEQWGRAAQRRAHDHLLIFDQLRAWGRLLETLVMRPAPDGPKG